MDKSLHTREAATPSAAISSAHSDTNPNDEPFYPGKDIFGTPVGDKVIEEVLIGRGYVKYYMLAFAVAFVAIMLNHWGTKLRSKYQKSRQQKPLPTVRIDKGQTRETTESTESTPLLQQPSLRSQNPFERVWLFMSGLLMLQPQGPYTAYLEPHSTTLALIYYYAITLVYIFYRYTHPMVLAFRLGMLCVANVPLLYVLGAKHSPLSFLTGCSYEQVNVYHRHVGRVCVLTLVAHTAIFLWYFRPAYLFTHAWSLMGIMAGTSFVVIGISSIRGVRQMFYESFYLIHAVGMVVALPTIYLHYPTAQPFAIVAGISIAYDRLVRVFDYRLVWSQIEVHEGDTVIIRIPKRGSPLGTKSYNPLVKLSDWFHRPLRWNSGQHIFVTLPGCGLFESHPFTIASSAVTSETMDVIIRAREGFTKRLLDQERLKPSETGRWVIIHGPYGVHPAGMPIPHLKDLGTHPYSELQGNSEDDDFTKDDGPDPAVPGRQKIVLVAGGAGIAFTYPLFEEYRLALSQSPESLGRPRAAQAILKTKLLEWKNKCLQDEREGREGTPTDSSSRTPMLAGTLSREDIEQSGLEFPDDFDLEFLWIIPHRSFLAWLPKLESQLSPRLPTNEVSSRVRARVWVTREDGRPDIRHEVRTMVGSYPSLDLASTIKDDKASSCWVSTCGPDYLVREVRNACAELRMSGRGDVEFYAEKFGW